MLIIINNNSNPGWDYFSLPLIIYVQTCVFASICIYEQKQPQNYNHTITIYTLTTHQLTTRDTKGNTKTTTIQQTKNHHHQTILYTTSMTSHSYMEIIIFIPDLFISTDPYGCIFHKNVHHARSSLGQLKFFACMQNSGQIKSQTFLSYFLPMI